MLAARREAHLMLARFAAGLGPGFLLAVAVTGLVAWSWPGPWQAALVPALVAFVPVWIAVICVGMRITRTARAWAWLTLLAVAGLVLLRGLQVAGWVR